MPSYIVTLKKNLSDAQKQKFKDDVKAQGGEIGHELVLINGYSVSYPPDHVGTLEKHEHVNTVEVDGEVKTQ